MRLSCCTVDLAGQRILRDDGDVALTSLEAALLRYLVDHPGTDVSRDELLAQVWGPSRRGTGRAVDFAVRRLRVKLGESAPPRHLLTAHGVGYRFVTGAELPSPPPPTVTVPVIRVATGRLDLGGRSFVRLDGPTVPLGRIEAELLAVLADRLGQPVARGDIVRQVWGRGRHDRSLDRTVARLRARLEVDPLRPEVLVTVKGVGPKLVGTHGSGRIRTNLVAPPTSFVARPERAEALAALGRHRLVTLGGTAGIGKTRLAREVGHDRLALDPAAEAWFCNLTTAGGAPGLAAAVALALGLPTRDADLPERVGRALARLPAGSVVILDNLEHLLRWAPLVAEWLAAAPGLRILATSRERLGIDGEHWLALRPLAEPEAARLFAERCRERSDADSETVRALVRRLDGLPLAIELAAARTDQLPPEELLARLGERLDLLVRPAPGGMSHHATLRGALDWSWDFLGPDERAVLGGVSVFVRPFDGAVAIGVLERDDAAAVLGRLSARSLVREEGPDRWGLYESVREYAAEKLVLSGRPERVRDRHAAVHLELADRWLRPAGPAALPHAVADLRDELVAALSRADVRFAEVALAVEGLANRIGPVSIGPGLLHEALGRGPPPALELRLVSRIADHERLAGDTESAGRWLERARRLAGPLGPAAIAGVDWRVATNLRDAGRLEEAARVADEAGAAFGILGMGAEEGQSLLTLAHARIEQGRYAEARTVLSRAGPKLPDWYGRVTVLRLLGEIALLDGSLDEAMDCGLELQRIARRVQHRLAELGGRTLVAGVLGARGELAIAERLYVELERDFSETTLGPQVLAVRLARALVAMERGDLDGAERLCRSVGSGGIPAIRAEAASTRAMLCLLQGRPADAVGLLEPFQDARFPLHVAQLTVALAALGRFDEAAAVSGGFTLESGPETTVATRLLRRVVAATFGDEMWGGKGRGPGHD